MPLAAAFLECQSNKQQTCCSSKAILCNFIPSNFICNVQVWCCCCFFYFFLHVQMIALIKEIKQKAATTTTDCNATFHVGTARFHQSFFFAEC